MSFITTIIKGISGKSTVTVNGKTYTGNNIQVTDNEVIIDGKKTGIADRKVVINITGNVESITTGSGNVSVTGDAVDIKTASGNVKVDLSVNGDISTVSGDIDVGSGVSGDIQTTTGDVDVNGPVSGKVSTLSGNITHR